MYECKFMCSHHKGFAAQQYVSRERHPVAFPVPPPICMVCDLPMVLASFSLPVDPIVSPPRRQIVRRVIPKGSLPLFPEYSA